MIPLLGSEYWAVQTSKTVPAPTCSLTSMFWDFFSDKEINHCQVKSVPSVYLLFFIALNILFKTVSKINCLKLRKFQRGSLVLLNFSFEGPWLMLLLLIKSSSKKFNKNSSSFLQIFCKISLKLRGIHHEVIFCQIIKSLHQNVRPRNIKSQSTAF